MSSTGVARRPPTARPACSPCQRTANETVDAGPTGRPWASRSTPRHAVGDAVGEQRRRPRARRRSTAATARDARRRRSRRRRRRSGARDDPGEVARRPAARRPAASTTAAASSAASTSHPARRATAWTATATSATASSASAVELAQADELADAEQEADGIVGRRRAARRAARRSGPPRRRSAAASSGSDEAARPLGQRHPAPGRRPRRRRRPGGSGPAPGPSWARATVHRRAVTDRQHDRRRPAARCPRSARRSAAGPSAGRGRVKAQAIGSGESLVDLDDRAAHRRRRPTTPAARRHRPGTRSRVSNTGAPSSRCWRTATSSAGRVPAVVGGDVPRQRRRAVPRHDVAPAGDVGPPRPAEHTGRSPLVASRPHATASRGRPTSAADRPSRTAGAYA